MTILSDICQKWFMCRPNGLLPCWNLNIFWHNSSTSFLSLCHFMVILVVINVLRHSLLVLKPIAILSCYNLYIFWQDNITCFLSLLTFTVQMATVIDLWQKWLIFKPTAKYTCWHLGVHWQVIISCFLDQYHILYKTVLCQFKGILIDIITYRYLILATFAFSDKETHLMNIFIFAQYTSNVCFSPITKTLFLHIYITAIRQIIIFYHIFSILITMFVIHIYIKVQNVAYISVGNTLYNPKVDILWLHHIFRYHYILFIFNNLQNLAKVSVGNTLYNPKADIIWLNLILWYHYIPKFSTCTSFYHSTVIYIDFLCQFYYKQREQFNVFISSIFDNVLLCQHLVCRYTPYFNLILVGTQYSLPKFDGIWLYDILIYSYFSSKYILSFIYLYDSHKLYIYIHSRPY